MSALAATLLPDKVTAIHVALANGRIPHAFGGALALAYYAEPRATIDVDVNVFLEPREHPAVARALGPLGVEPAADLVALERDGQARWRWDRTPIDLFFANHAIHAAMHDQLRNVPFGDTRIPILAPEHLLVCKVAFDRPKDWLDIEQILVVEPEIDRGEVERWIDDLLPEDDERRDRLAGLLG